MVLFMRRGYKPSPFKTEAPARIGEAARWHVGRDARTAINSHVVAPGAGRRLKGPIESVLATLLVRHRESRCVHRGSLRSEVDAIASHPPELALDVRSAPARPGLLPDTLGHLVPRVLDAHRVGDEGVEAAADRE